MSKIFTAIAFISLTALGASFIAGLGAGFIATVSTETVAKRDVNAVVANSDAGIRQAINDGELASMLNEPIYVHMAYFKMM
jgi:hypothetical protein